MAVLKYWDVGTSAYVAVTGVPGPAGPQGPPGIGINQVAGVIGADFNVTTAMQTFLSTGSLAVGLWMVTFTGQGYMPLGQNSSLTVQVVIGTAAGSFSGPTGTQILWGAAGQIAANTYPLSFTCFANITAPGALALQAIGVGGSSGYLRRGVVGGAIGTGYVAIQIA
jgi:hypothetical protein